MKKYYYLSFLAFTVACGSMPSGPVDTTGSTSGTTRASGTAASTADLTAAVASGTALYNNNCASCHSGLSNSNISGTTADRIQLAIDGNWGGMGQLGSLTPTDLQDIEAALDPANATTSSTSSSSGSTTPSKSDTGNSGTDHDKDSDGVDDKNHVEDKGP